VWTYVNITLRPPQWITCHSIKSRTYFPNWPRRPLKWSSERNTRTLWCPMRNSTSSESLGNYSGAVWKLLFAPYAWFEFHHFSGPDTCFHQLCGLGVRWTTMAHQRVRRNSLPARFDTLTWNDRADIPEVPPRGEPNTRKKTKDNTIVSLTQTSCLRSFQRGIGGTGEDTNPPKSKKTINVQTLFLRHLAFRPRDWSHWIRLEIPWRFVVCMCPELRYGRGSDKHRFWDTPSKKMKVCSNVAGKHHV